MGTATGSIRKNPLFKEPDGSTSSFPSVKTLRRICFKALSRETKTAFEFRYGGIRLSLSAILPHSVSAIGDDLISSSPTGSDLSIDTGSIIETRPIGPYIPKLLSFGLVHQ